MALRPVADCGKLAQMADNPKGTFHLARIAGVDLLLHWSWFLVAFVQIGYLRNRYTSLIWSVLEYLALFLIVLLHEFGHAMACRQVGGVANRILLWPLGGVAYVDPPQRPGATLWSLAAGPLVNVALLIPFGSAFVAARSLGWRQTMPNAFHWLGWVLAIDAGLLIFNMMPVYPLDGGQILRSLLWFFLGRGRSLVIATVVGFIGAGGFILLALRSRSIWMLMIAGYLLINCWSGFKTARILLGMEKIPRRQGFACPSCRTRPPLGVHWKCTHCDAAFDTFATQATCPACGAQFDTTMCLDCRRSGPMREWTTVAPSGA